MTGVSGLSRQLKAAHGAPCTVRQAGSCGEIKELLFPDKGWLSEVSAHTHFMGDLTKQIENANKHL